MDPTLITADEKNHAKRGSLWSPEFRRMVGLVWPHRRFIILGFVASIVYGFLNSVSVMGMLPVLKLMLSDEGLHGWLDKTVASQRLNMSFQINGDDLVVTEFKGSPPAEKAWPISALVAYRVMGAGAGGGKAGEPLPIQARPFLGVVAGAAPEAVFELQFRGVGAKAEVMTRSVTLRRAAWSARGARWLASWLPRERVRRDRIKTLAWILGVVLVLVILSNVARFVAQYYVAVGTLRAVMDLRLRMYRKILRLPMDFFSRDISDLVSRFVQDAQEIQRGLLALFGKTLREPVRAMFLFAWALWLNARITLTLCVALPAAMLIFWAVGRKIRKANKRLLRTYGVMIGALTTTLHAIGVIKAYNAENQERMRLWRIDRRMFEHLLRLVKLEAILRPLLEVLAVAGIAAVTIWLGAQVIEKKIALPDFVQLIFVLGMTLDPLRKLSDVYPRVMRSAAGAARTFAVADLPEEAERREGSHQLAPLAEAIEFKNVTFTYPQAPGPALRGVNLRIEKGETVAIVGANGSGKTTLTNLLVRFFDPQEGAVRFDGVDIREAELRSLRRQISMVSQDPVVFAMSIAENIAYGTRHATKADIEAAAHKAHAEAFILEKAAGYDEFVGERGSSLSGGQRQRLCIARAMMRDAPILIFDEATSQIDSESESQIQEAVRDFSTGRTTILIAHRLNTIRFAERVIVMEEGRVLDTGTHEELLQRCPMYTTLCQTQLGS